MHPNEIPTTCDIEWQPVLVEMTAGRKVTIYGPLQALSILVTDWPNRDGNIYDSARRACIAALEHKRSPGEARAAFLAALMAVDLRMN